ncbi:MAG: hypothetical protein ACP5MD_06160 [Verrucomicrobiia bacterium]
MNSNRNRDSLLAVIGLVAVLAYVLACTSFSPDDSKVLYPKFDTKGGGIALAVFDRDSRSSEQLLTLPAPPKMETLLRGVWTSDGSRVVALWPAPVPLDKSEQLNVLVLPYKTRQPVCWFALPIAQEKSTMLAVPPIVVGSSLFLCAESLVIRLDFETGAVQTNEVDGSVVLLKQGDRICYLHEKKSDDPSQKKSYELGDLDLNKLTLAPRFSFPEKPDEDIFGFFAVSRDGSRIALLCERSGESFFRIYEGNELSKTIPAGVGTNAVQIGNFLFSPDGSTLYAACSRPPAETKEAGVAQQCGILEVPLTGASAREIPLFKLQEDWDKEHPVFLFQLDLSHDGKTLAVCSTYLVVEEPARLKTEDLALYLVDLTRPDRKVTKVPIPPPPKSSVEE